MNYDVLNFTIRLLLNHMYYTSRNPSLIPYNRFFCSICKITELKQDTKKCITPIAWYQIEGEKIFCMISALWAGWVLRFRHLGQIYPFISEIFFPLSFALRPWSVPLPLLKSLVNVVSIEEEGDSDSQHRRKKGGISSCLTFAQKIKIIYERDWDKRTWLTQKRERRDVEEKIERE